MAVTFVSFVCMPPHIRNAATITTFKSALKTPFFSLSHSNSALFDLICVSACVCVCVCVCERERESDSVYMFDFCVH